MNQSSIASYLAMLGIPPALISTLTGGQQSQNPTLGTQPQLADQTQSVGGAAGQQQPSQYAVPSWLTPQQKQQSSGGGSSGGGMGGIMGGLGGGGGGLGGGIMA